MILTKQHILTEIEKGNLVVDPFTPDMVGPASIDLTLDNEIRVFERIDDIVSVTDLSDYRDITRKITVKETYRIKPNELILGITKERIKLPGNIAGWLNSRSRFARLGLMVHITAPFIQPGQTGQQVLEIYNTGPNILDLIPGQRLCQLILQRCEGTAEYAGKFQDQEL
ncbi:dCTP deaminase [Candidatus Woesebacteria bacterium]|nr:dCTP deaminase [Candidatus Woesebacteria bacterium]